MPKPFICSECGEEYDPLVTEDDCGLCAACVNKIAAEDLDYEFFGTVLA